MSRSQGNPAPSRVATAEWAALLVMAAAMFVLQAWHLRQAGAPYSDEGVYAEAGRLIWRGLLPHRDFPLFHMPLLPFLLGAAVRWTGGLDAARFVYLALNCVTVLPLYFFLRALHPSRPAAFAGAFFYLAFHEMVHHDFRWVAIRPLANTLFLLFAWVTTTRSDRRWAAPAQLVLVVLSALLFLPALVNLVLFSLAIVAWEADRERRRALGRKLAVVLALGSLSVVTYLHFVPGSFGEIVLAQAARARVPLTARLAQMFGSPRDGFFYALALGGWIAAFSLLPRLRPFAAAFLLIWALNVFGPSNFYPHYAVIAAPALTFGVFAFVLSCARVSRGARAPAAAAAALAALQLCVVSGSLAHELFGNIDPEHHALIDRLRTLPGPLLTCQPVYAVESGQFITPDLEELALRPPFMRSRIDATEFWVEAARKSGAILLEPRILFYLERGPRDVLPIWNESFEVALTNRAGTILIPRSTPGK